jgi:hypothetical protein
LKLPNLDRRAIDIAKISAYLLNARHPVGAAKAAFFFGFGFQEGEPERLRDAIMTHPVDNQVISTVTTPFGAKYVVQCMLNTPDGRNPCIRSIWVIEAIGMTPRLVTAYPMDATPS